MDRGLQELLSLEEIFPAELSDSIASRLCKRGQLSRAHDSMFMCVCVCARAHDSMLRMLSHTPKHSMLRMLSLCTV